jgi:hypothetical protein
MRRKQIPIGGIISGGIFRMSMPEMNPKDGPNDDLSRPTEFVNASHFASIAFFSKTMLGHRPCVSPLYKVTRNNRLCRRKKETRDVHLYKKEANCN